MAILAAALAALVLVVAWWRLFRDFASQPPILSAPVALENLATASGTRTYKVFVPTAFCSSNALLLVLHGSAGSADQMRRYTGQEFERLADEHGFIVAYPEGYRGYWNDARRKGGYAAKRHDIDDVAFLRALIEHLRARHGVGDVFAVGYSNGGYMCIRMALEAGDAVRAIAMFGANMPTDDNCVAPALVRQMPAMLVNGTRDPITPYDGGHVSIFGFGDRGTVRSALASAQYFAARLAGDVAVEGASVVEPVADRTGTHVDLTSWGSASGDRVLLYTVHGGGHVVPQPRYRFARFVGETEMRFNAPAAVCDFFAIERPERARPT